MKSINGQKARISYLILIKQFMIFTTNKSKLKNTDFEFHSDDATTLTRTISTKILGIDF